MSRVKEEQEEYRKRIGRLSGSMPWLKTKEVKSFRAKVFKSGNSLALRLPAGLGLTAGMEMNLRVENGEFFSFESVERPKRKLNVAKFWGSVPGLKLIAPEDREFEPSRRPWDDPQWPGWAEEPR
ncbi:MAG: antitoxin VapB [Sphingomonadales bacterium]|jgi:antitoxin VapB|nr:antitoxin VapB [Sphingomonadales bacterium]